MAQQLKKFYKRFLSSPLLDGAIRGILEVFVDTFGKYRHLSFPDNYIRQWKWDMLLERYESDSVSLMRKIIKPGMVVVDVGAHIGYFTRIFSKLTGGDGLVYAFEADPAIFQLLKKNTKHFRNTRLYQLAITDRAGTIDFYHSEEKSGCGSVLPIAPVEFRRRKIQASANSLDAILAKEGVTRVDFIKMDIEGGEPTALRGMRKILEKNQNILLIIEFNPEWLRAGDIAPLDFLRELKQLGFKVFGILNGQVAPFDPKNEQEMKKIVPPYGKIPGFINIYCRRPQA